MSKPMHYTICWVKPDAVEVLWASHSCRLEARDPDELARMIGRLIMNTINDE